MNYAKTTINRGYTNRILAIDLGSAAITLPPLDPQVRDYFLGGRSLGLYLLHRAITPETLPTDPATRSSSPTARWGGFPSFPVRPRRWQSPSPL